MTAAGVDLAGLAGMLRASRNIAAKGDIACAAGRMGLDRAVAGVPVGDDCAAIPDGDGYVLLAIEGFMNEFVAADPWFAGWCVVMVNLSDIAAMGGRPTAVVDALWAKGDDGAAAILDGMKAASERYGVPVVGGHTNLTSDRGQLAVAVLGRASRLLTSFDARPGDRLVAAIDLRGCYREPFSNWEAATSAPAARLRGDLELLPLIAEKSLSRAAKDISQGGIVGTVAMLAECSGVGAVVDVNAVPRPAGIPLDRWMSTFPSYGYLIAAASENVAAITELFRAREIAAADIGAITAGCVVSITDGVSTAVVRDLDETPLLGLRPAEACT
jgi:AIR synthase-related protein